jgi:hypothetical protein
MLPSPPNTSPALDLSGPVGGVACLSSELAELPGQSGDLVALALVLLLLLLRMLDERARRPTHRLLPISVEGSKESVRVSDLAAET